MHEQASSAGFPSTSRTPLAWRRWTWSRDHRLGAATGVALGLRGGAVLAMVARQVGPFLARAAHSVPTPGLVGRPDIKEWLLQPLGMVLLGAVTATIGAASGALLRRDAIGLWSVLRRHRLSSLPLAAGALLVVAAAGAAATALQIGPVSGLYQYASGASSGAGAPLAASGDGNPSRRGGAGAAVTSLTLADRRTLTVQSLRWRLWGRDPGAAVAAVAGQAASATAPPQGCGGRCRG